MQTAAPKIPKGDDSPEDRSHDPAGRRLGHEDPRTGAAARPDRPVPPARQRLLQALHVLDGRGEIRIREKDPRPGSRQHAGADGEPLAAVGAAGQELHARVARRVAAGHFGGPVRAAVVYDEDFPRAAAAVEIGEHRFESGAQARFLVVGGDHDAQKAAHMPPPGTPLGGRQPGGMWKTRMECPIAVMGERPARSFR